MDLTGPIASRRPAAAVLPGAAGNIETTWSTPGTASRRSSPAVHVQRQAAARRNDRSTAYHDHV